MRSSHASSSTSKSSHAQPSSTEKEQSLKKRNRRKTVRAKREQSVQEERALAHQTMVEPVLSSVQTNHDDHVRTLDLHLAKRAQVKSTKAQPKRVQIRFQAHEPSAHVIRLQGMARRIPTSRREPAARSIQAWVAPYEAAPSLERMAAEAVDLYIDHIDASELYRQFTPFDPEIAYRERRGFWQRVRSPFIRWELAWQPVTLEPQEVDSGLVVDENSTVTAEEVIVPPRSLEMDAGEPPAVIPTGFEEQFTTGEPVRPITSRARRFWHAASDWIEDTADRIRTGEEEVVQEAEQVLSVPMLVPRVDIIRVFAGFVVLLCLVSLPAGAVSLSRSFSSTIEKTVAVTQGAAEEAKGAFAGGMIHDEALGRASTQFAQANDELAHANGIATALVQTLPKTRDVYRASRLLLEAGQDGTRAAQLMAEGIQAAWSQSVTHPDERLLTLQTHLRAATPLVAQANKAIAAIDVAVLPVSTRAQVEGLQQSLQQGERALADVSLLTDLGLTAVGHDRPRTYLFIFQNQTELRPTGGFMGSIAEVVLDRGELRSIRVPGGGPYDLRNQLLTRVRPPEPLQLVSSRWEFQDANWFADFPTAAQKINWFWSEAGQPTLDGIVTINAKVLQDLMRITGPVTLAAYGKTFDAENVLFELQKSVELEYDKTENKPKKIIGDLLPEILSRLRGLSQDQLLVLMGSLTNSLQTKDIQLWFRGVDEQATIAALGWDGAFPEGMGDTLAVNEANIGGQKTDAVIQEHVDHEIEMKEDGSVFDTVTLYRRHTGEKGELFHGANNVAYVRLYTPAGAELLEATGFQPPPKSAYKAVLPEDPMDADIARIEAERLIDPSGVRVTEEFGRTVFGGWVQLGPGASSKTMFRYQLPLNAFDLADRLDTSTDLAQNQHPQKRAAYLLSLVSQSGKTDRGVTVRLRVPLSWNVAWSNQDWRLEGATRVLSFAGWDRNRVIALLFDTDHEKTR